MSPIKLSEATKAADIKVLEKIGLILMVLWAFQLKKGIVSLLRGFDLLLLYVAS